MSNTLHIPDQGEPPETLSKESKGTLKIMFFILFLDLIGFSIVFPLYPSVLKYYLGLSDQGILGGLVSLIEVITEKFASGSHTIAMAKVVLFGGILSFIYSLLQFLIAPLTGTLSDKFGRKPVLFICLAGIAISNLLWIFSGSFELFFWSRILGGIMGSNITTATAVVADITSPKTRSKGMAIIGIAFGIGFIIGPTLGGISAQLNLLNYFPSLETYGINPFSVSAFISFIMSMLSLHFVFWNYKETLPEEKRGKGKVFRSINPLTLFKAEKYPGVSKTVFSYFIFLTAFSGAEFTLTFLAFDRLGYSPLQNGLMFLFVGIILTLIQGGYVRRKAAKVGEAKMAKNGMYILMPGLVLVGVAHSSWVLFFGLFLMAVGSAQVIPCLTSLTSMYTPPTEQGRVLGVFRSLGALGRTIGPLLACVYYWKLGGTSSYVINAVCIIVPIVMVMMLPVIQKKDV